MSIYNSQSTANIGRGAQITVLVERVIQRAAPLLSHRYKSGRHRVNFQWEWNVILFVIYPCTLHKIGGIFDN